MTAVAQDQTNRNKHPYHIELDVFEGPLDLLLHLIKENDVDIFNIPVAQITEEYLSYIEAMETLNLNIAGEFILMASTLAHIKSKMLLPPDPSQEDPEDEGKDPREELVRRLLEYQKYKMAAAQFDSFIQLGQDVFVREKTRKLHAKDQPIELAEISIFKLIQSFHKILDNIPLDITHDVEKEIYSIDECAQEITSFFKKRRKNKVRFMEMFQKIRSKPKVVASFLAILAMIKRGALVVFQLDHFDEIELIATDQLYQGDVHYDETEFTGILNTESDPGISPGPELGTADEQTQIDS
ncbi:MAG: segregation/condensation protein A [Bdellovibrionales bacterium]|nr:segregation/condensation protein A [Bdellovibrionales bacterium]